MLTDIGLNKVIEDGLKYNLRSAALCGVLLQENDIFTLEEFFTTITSLSYHGEHSASLIRRCFTNQCYSIDCKPRFIPNYGGLQSMHMVTAIRTCI